MTRQAEIKLPRPNTSGLSAGPISSEFIDQLRGVVGKSNVVTSEAGTRRYRTGFRFGGGPALAVVKPATLVEMWRSLQLCAKAGTIVIIQAANTGLTGGSTPDGADYDRQIVIINTMRLSIVHPIRGGQQVVCLPGSTLYELTDALDAFGREPHSVIGSSCIGASVFGGICNNSGGALIHRGPAFTQMTLHARIGDDGSITLVNHLSIDLGEDPETILRRIEDGDFDEGDITDDLHRHCSDPDYQTHVRDIDADTPARFNADPRRLFEAAGSGGKVMVFAVRLDSFPKNMDQVDFYIGTNDPTELTCIRRNILRDFRTLPVEGEYIHRSAFALTQKYGKDTFLAIRYLGAKWLPKLFKLKSQFDNLTAKSGFLPKNLSDRMMQFVADIFPNHLPKRLIDYHENFEHHLILRVADEGIDEARAYLANIFPTRNGNYFECTKDEGERAFLHRFAVAGASIRYRALNPHLVSEIVALDVALPRNDVEWAEQLPPELADKIDGISYCGHFFCHVFHRDYLIKVGEDPKAFEHAMWKILDAQGAEYPAEHNVGHLYRAKPALEQHYRHLDPGNVFNPGIGQTSKNARWA